MMPLEAVQLDVFDSEGLSLDPRPVDELDIDGVKVLIGRIGLDMRPDIIVHCKT
jgi:hypothetical protein